MRLYTQVINMNKFMLVSHRNMISVYDMTKDVLANKDNERGQVVAKAAQDD